MYTAFIINMRFESYEGKVTLRLYRYLSDKINKIILNQFLKVKISERSATHANPKIKAAHYHLTPHKHKTLR